MDCSIPRILDLFGQGQGQGFASRESLRKLPVNAKSVRRLQFEKDCGKTCITLHRCCAPHRPFLYINPRRHQVTYQSSQWNSLNANCPNLDGEICLGTVWIWPSWSCWGWRSCLIFFWPIEPHSVLNLAGCSCNLLPSRGPWWDLTSKFRNGSPANVWGWMQDLGSWSKSRAPLRAASGRVSQQDLTEGGPWNQEIISRNGQRAAWKCILVPLLLFQRVCSLDPASLLSQSLASTSQSRDAGD